MRPVNMESIGEELAIRWEDGHESFIRLERLRRACPCAGCHGEMDILGNVYKTPAHTLSPSAFRLARIESVGTYAVQPTWADGHNAGLYTFDYLNRLSDAEPKA